MPAPHLGYKITLFLVVVEVVLHPIYYMSLLAIGHAETDPAPHLLVFASCFCWAATAVAPTRSVSADPKIKATEESEATAVSQICCGGVQRRLGVAPAPLADAYTLECKADLPHLPCDPNLQGQ